MSPATRSSDLYMMYVSVDTRIHMCVCVYRQVLRDKHAHKVAQDRAEIAHRLDHADANLARIALDKEKEQVDGCRHVCVCVCVCIHE